MSVGGDTSKGGRMRLWMVIGRLSALVVSTQVQGLRSRPAPPGPRLFPDVFGRDRIGAYGAWMGAL